MPPRRDMPKLLASAYLNLMTNMFARTKCPKVLVELFQNDRGTFVSALRKRSAFSGRRPESRSAEREIPLFVQSIPFIK